MVILIILNPYSPIPGKPVGAKRKSRIIGARKYQLTTKGRKDQNTKKKYFKFGAHAAHTPRKRWRCGSASAARFGFRVFVVNLLF
jgi:hypothetical protein